MADQGCAVNGAYPRSRGGTVSAAQRYSLVWGLSPLARGNRAAVPLGVAVCGPIPARAGEPTTALMADAATWAYPRSRGGTLRLGTDLGECVGLSPLARGNQSGRAASVP